MNISKLPSHRSRQQNKSCNLGKFISLIMTV